MNTPTPMSAEPEIDSSPRAVKPLYVTVLMVPIVGLSGTIQSRSLVFARPPTKESAIETVTGIHMQSDGGAAYNGEWLRCADTLSKVPEELFSQMNQRRARKITYPVQVRTADGQTHSRLVTARSCFVHGWSRDLLDRLLP